MGRASWALLVAALHLAPATAAPPLQDLARDTVGDDQGVYVVDEAGVVLAARLENRPVHPASVTKVATTLALLERLGPDHRFATRVLEAGTSRDGRLAGVLVVEASGDPFFVSEHALAILQRLHAGGLRRVDGGLLVRGPLLFNWKPDPDGRRLRATLAGEDGDEAWRTVAPGPDAPRLADVSLHFADADPPASALERVVAVHQSPTLREMTKALNGYSNNVFHPMSDAIGGPHAVEAAARAHVGPALAGEVVIDNAAGGGKTNRLSPRAAVAILTALEAALGRVGLDLPDVLPVSGIDAGTLRERFDGPGERGTVVGKTGTYGDVGACALVGVLRTRRHGRVRFAILDAWLPVPEARRRQDALVRGLIRALDAEPWPYAAPAPTPVAAARLE